MPSNETIRIDGIKWWITQIFGGDRLPIPICPLHNMRIYPIPTQIYISLTRKYIDDIADNAIKLECAEGPHQIEMPRIFSKEKQYIIDRVDAKIFKNMKVLNIDDEAIPIAESKVTSPDKKYFVTSRLMGSKRGLQLVVYAGERGKKEKTQIFIEPRIKRLAFDQNNVNPTDVFLELKATFDDGSSQTIAKNKK